MSESHFIAMLGTGFIADFYTSTLHSQRSMDRVHTVYSRSAENGKAFQDKWNIPNKTTDLNEAVQNDDIDTVIIGLPNHRHRRRFLLQRMLARPFYARNHWVGLPKKRW